MSAIHGYIFDMNGVIINDERFHQYSWKELCKKWGKNLTEEQFEKEVFGRREKETFSFLLGRDIQEQELGALSDERTQIVMDVFGDQIKPVPGITAFLQQLAAAGIPIGLATSSRKPYMNYILDTFELQSYFSAIVSGEDCSRGKPDPEIYLKAASLLNVDPKTCIAFEDSLSGIASARSAGMKVVGIATTQDAQELTNTILVVKDFTELTSEMIRELK